MTDYTWPHDDSTSLINFYGQPWLNSGLMTTVVPPFRLTFEGTVVHGILIHKKCAKALTEALQTIWDTYNHDQAALDATGFTKYSGSFNYRNVRGGQRLSCHAFAAAMDFDAEDIPLGSPKRLPDNIVRAFTAVGAFYGGDFINRKDGMHIQFANERS